MSVGDLQQAVSAQDSGRLVRIPGIGKKTAERLLLELRDKLAGGLAAAQIGAPAQAAGSDVLNALLALGYSEKEATWALKQVDAALSVGEAIRQCLRLLSKA
jgi:Holliday junction DNA helicase RuvA